MYYMINMPADLFLSSAYELKYDGCGNDVSITKKFALLYAHIESVGNHHISAKADIYGRVSDLGKSWYAVFQAPPRCNWRNPTLFFPT